MYDDRVFEIIRTWCRRPAGSWRVTDLNNVYIQEQHDDLRRPHGLVDEPGTHASKL